MTLYSVRRSDFLSKKKGEIEVQERLVIHGGATRPGSIGQSCSTLDLIAKENKYRIMIDSGMEFITEAESGGSGPGADLALLNDGKKVDALILTHSHIDHIGWVVVVLREKYLSSETRIICSPQTAKVLPYALEDGLKRNPQYTAFDAAEVLDRLLVIPKPGEFEVLTGLKGFFPQCGHIPGAMWVVLPTSSGKKGLIMSDWCAQDQPVTKGALLPSQIFPPEWIPDEIWGTDLTYGSQTKKPLKEEIGRLVAQTKAELAQGHKVIIAAFANGKGQNVAYWLAKAGIEIWIDGAIRSIWSVFQNNRWSDRDGGLPKLGERGKIRPVESEEHRAEIIADPTPRVVVTTGGMGDFGPIVSYFKVGLPQKEWVFFFTSWLAPGCNGAKLLRMDTKKENHPQPDSFQLVLYDRDEKMESITFRAAVDRFGISAHGDLDDSEKFIKNIIACRGGRPLDKIVMTHGTQESKTAAAKRFAPLSKNIIYGERNTIISLAA